MGGEFPSSYDGMKGAMLSAVGDNYTLKDKILQLNREIASRDSEIQKLKDRILQMKRAGDYDEEGVHAMLMEVLEDRYPRERITWQRKEIVSLHRVIKRLRGNV